MQTQYNGPNRTIRGFDMASYGWNDCPTAVREQVDRLAAMLSDCLADRLVGIYLHGSLALGCFNPNRSDLDLLVVTTERMPLALKRQVVEYLLECSQQPQPIEISFLAQAQLLPWRYPPPFDLHYSEGWRTAQARDLATGAWQAWDALERRDPDLAAHITILNRRGARLAGAPIAAVFPAVPEQDYRASIAGDIRDALASIADNPVYAILNCCRTYAYIRHGHVFSKLEGGDWALQVLPEDFRPPVAGALAAYRSDAGQPSFDPDALSRFAAAMRQVLAPILA